MKKYVWMVIAVVVFFLALIVAYTLGPAQPGVAGAEASSAEKAH